MASSEEVLIESVSEAISKNLCLNSQELNFTKESHLAKLRKSEVYVEISEQCKVEAARQTSNLMKFADNLCKKESPQQRRKGKVIKKLAPQVEKYVFNGIQEKICDAMWLNATHKVFGTPQEASKSETIFKKETQSPKSHDRHQFGTGQRKPLK